MADLDIRIAHRQPRWPVMGFPTLQAAVAQERLRVARTVGASVIDAVIDPPFNALMFDDFNYVVNRNDSDKSAFVSNGPWSFLKSEPAQNGNGFLYTVGPSGVQGPGSTFPPGVSRVLMMEAVPVTEGFQTDFYLALGGAANPENEDIIPANLWMQFWILNINSGSQLSSRRNQNKFFYVCNGDYGCHTHLWMLREGACNYWPAYNTYCSTFATATPFFWEIARAVGVSTIASTAPGVDPDSNDQLGHNIGADLQASSIPANSWRLCKFNVDTSNQAAGGRARIWTKPIGGSFTLVMDHQNGVNGLQWTFPVARGHREVRMPSTVGSDTVGNYFMAMADFAIASSEADLPTY